MQSKNTNTKPKCVCVFQSKVDQYCNLAEGCIHDTIPICGKLNEEKRTFLDHCDLLEYACDTNFGNFIYYTLLCHLLGFRISKKM